LNVRTVEQQQKAGFHHLHAQNKGAEELEHGQARGVESPRNYK
jgi:hypothetical protein